MDTVRRKAIMARFDTDHILDVITHDNLADHETNRVVLESFLAACDREITHAGLVRDILEAVLRQAAQSQHGRDLVVGLLDRFMAEAKARSLAEIELTAAGFDEDEIEETLRDFPDEFTPEALEVRHTRGPTRQELDEGGAI
jgi:ABC-type thiamine transport system substrate-binding protein